MVLKSPIISLPFYFTDSSFQARFASLFNALPSLLIRVHSRLNRTKYQTTTIDIVSSLPVQISHQQTRRTVAPVAMSNFRVSPATLPDLPGIARISQAAFAENRHTMSYWMLPQNNERAIFEWRLKGVTKTFEDIPYCAYTKVVDETTGRIVAFALWEAPHSPEMEEETAQKEQENQEKGKKDDDLAEGTNVQLLHDFEAETRVRTFAPFSSVQSYRLGASLVSNLRGIILCF